MQNNIIKNTLSCFCPAKWCKLMLSSAQRAGVMLILKIKLSFTQKISVESQNLNAWILVSNDGDFSDFSALTSLLPIVQCELSTLF